MGKTSLEWSNKTAMYTFAWKKLKNSVNKLHLASFRKKGLWFLIAYPILRIIVIKFRVGEKRSKNMEYRICEG